MQLSDFDYELPKELIAQEPVRPRSDSRLMIVDGENIEHKLFLDILNYFKKGDVLVINETKVMKVRLVGKKLTGSEVQLIITGKKSEGVYICRIATRNPHVGCVLKFQNELEAEIVQEVGESFLVKFNKQNIEELLDEIGELPTPSYVTEKLKKDEYYQTVYAKKEGSVAAPTAGLHFTFELLKKIASKGVKIVNICLHVTFGTFLPVRDEGIKNHKMEKEYYEISQESADLINDRKGRLFCVGTTSFKTLQSATEENGKVRAEKKGSELFIYPGVKLNCKVDYLITNFHLPKSTLILLVSAFVGREIILNAYHVAVNEKYRFYSFGDAMLIKGCD